MNNLNSFGSATNNFPFNAQPNTGPATPGFQGKPIGFSSPFVSQTSVFGTPNSNNNLFNSSTLGSSIAAVTSSTQFGSTSMFGNVSQSTFGLNNNTQSTTSSTGFSFNNTTQQPMFTNNNLIGSQTNNLFNNNSTASGFAFGSSSTQSSNILNTQNPVVTSSKAFSFGASNSVSSVAFGAVSTNNSTVSGTNLSFSGSGFLSNIASTIPTLTPTPAPAAISVNQQSTTGFSFGSLQSNPISSASTSNSTNFGSLGFTLQNSSTGSFISPLTTSSTPLSFTTNNTISTFSLTSTSITTTTTMTPQTTAMFPFNSTPTSTLLSVTKPSTTTSPFSLNLNMSTTTTTPALSTALSSGLTTSGLGGGISSNKPNIASPLAMSSISSKKGLGGSPISESSKSVVLKDSSQKVNVVVNQMKDAELQPELKETVEAFKKYVSEQKNLREDVMKSNEVVNLIVRVDEESQILRHSISEVANGLQKIQLQSNKLKNDIAKEESSIKTAQISSDASLYMTIDRSDCSHSYFTNKVRELETRAGLYLQEIELVESMCQSANNQNRSAALTSRDLVDIIRKMDDEFIGLAAKLYNVHERVKAAKAEYLRRHSRATHENQNPFLSIEGRFGDTFESIGRGLNWNTSIGNGSGNNGSSTSRKSMSMGQNNENVGGSPFEIGYYMNNSNSTRSIVGAAAGPGGASSFYSLPGSSSPATASKLMMNNNSNTSGVVGSFQKPMPSIFGGLNSNNNSSIITGTVATNNGLPTVLTNVNNNTFLGDSVSNKKRR